MTTTAQAILDAAIASSLANDAGATNVASDTTELLNVLNRKVQQIYTLAGMPQRYGGMGGNPFGTSTPVTVQSAAVALPAAAFRPKFVRADGKAVAVVLAEDVDDGFAELPPAVIVERETVRSAGRSGDPIPGDILTVRYTAQPGTLTLGTHFIGATTPTDSSTSTWPSHVGDPFLVAWLARYLAMKAGDREPSELEGLTQDLAEAADTLGAVLGVSKAALLAERGA